MQSTGNFSCDTFDNWKDNTIHGTYECKAATNNPTTSDGSSGSSTSTSTSSADDSDSTEDAAVLTAANVPVMGAAAIFGMLVQYVL
jgi:hypothetical protein